MTHKRSLGYELNKLRGENSTLRCELLRLHDQQRTVEKLQTHCRDLSESLQSVLSKNAKLQEELDQLKKRPTPRKKVAVSG